MKSSEFYGTSPIHSMFSSHLYVDKKNDYIQELSVILMMIVQENITETSSGRVV